MQAFTTLTGIAAPIPKANVDTDQIIPARFIQDRRRVLPSTLRDDGSIGGRDPSVRPAPRDPTEGASAASA